ncbi:hypothetical protein BS50DRAFT_165002 [Corynespora cassiicola Philippines]|uniref:Uncharacterized protein n=1 Tax=Corynespora cassiicola Philippines TaxID=1448308 RepID=A0A2T2N6N8_CORCC|nr:hypothetical protein BS50DRAFT_165002 [Corynespora cassiicola Philippines]
MIIGEMMLYKIDISIKSHSNGRKELTLISHLYMSQCFHLTPRYCLPFPVKYSCRSAPSITDAKGLVAMLGIGSFSYLMIIHAGNLIELGLGYILVVAVRSVHGYPLWRDITNRLVLGSLFLFSFAVVSFFYKLLSAFSTAL